MNKAYQRINWQNKPATATPTGATNFNKMDKAIDDIDNRVVEMNGSIESMQVAINGKASATALSDEVTARQNADSSLLTALNNHSTLINNKYDKVYSDGTDGTLTDSDDGLLQNMVVKGKCEQTQLSGKNLLNSSLQTTTLNGMTCERLSDGTYRLNGTASAYTSFVLENYQTNNYVGKKIVGALPTTNGNIKITCAYTDASGTYVSSNSDVGNGAIIENYSKVGIFIVCLANAVANNLVFKPMICADTSATYADYEQYCGGIPAPNPTYPQTIHKVENAKVVVRGKNLFDTSSIYRSGYYQGLDGSYGTETNWNVYSIPTKPNTQYTISFKCLIKGTCRIHSCNADETWVANIGNVVATSGNSYQLTFTATTTKTHISIGKPSEVNTDIQLEVGTSATDYAEYTEQSVPTNLTLYGIGSTCDYVDVERGKIVRCIGSNTVSEFGVQGWNSDRLLLYNGANADLTKALMTEKYAFVAWANYSTYDYAIATNGTYPAIRDVTFTSRDDAISKVGTMPILYVKQTPTEEDISAELLAQLRALTSYYPSTNLAITSDDINGNASFSYPLNLESFIKNVETDVTSLIDALA